MQLLLDHFPVFEANQVLTSAHLNNVFNYLDQQGRLTRSHLIGIGIVCGLELRLDTSAGTAILLSQGCGVTSQGYLLVEPEDVRLTSYRPYIAPDEPAYPPFTGPAREKYPLWELFEAGEPGTTPLTSPEGFLDDKAVLLFLELKSQGLRNCSPNSCDDRGSEMITTVRRLLIKRSDLEKIICSAAALGTGLTPGDLDAALSSRLALPDLRLRRFDVPNLHPVTAEDVYAAFLRIFRGQGLAHALANALSAAYAAFKPLLQKAYPSDPFTNFAATFGFLDDVPTSTGQVKFLQYYVDLFDDLVRAYDELRWKGAELVCACCPADDLFPRHLMLGLAHPESVSTPAHYRQGFLPSPAIGGCSQEIAQLVGLFARLVEMTRSFSDKPSLPRGNPDAAVDPQIRITPSVVGCEPLARRAIPYYYAQSGSPPLYKLWNMERTSRNRANQNLGYRSDEYAPIAPAFVLDPLGYDLECYDFLRIEGHLGKSYRYVLGTLLELRSRQRLPIDVIALRTGPYDDSQDVDMAAEEAWFEDLQALYAALRSELLSSLAQAAMQLYDAKPQHLALPGGSPNLALLKAFALGYTYRDNSIGAWFEQNLAVFEGKPYLDVEQSRIDGATIKIVYETLLKDTSGLSDGQYYPHVVMLFYAMKLFELLPDKLSSVIHADLANGYQDLLALTRFFYTDLSSRVSANPTGLSAQDELLDLLADILFNSKVDAFASIEREVARRIGELRKRQFLADFLTRHPGVQHKAGVPIGGTFILVYHAAPRVPDDDDRRDDRDSRGRRPQRGVGERNAPSARRSPRARAAADAGTGSRITDPALLHAISRINANGTLAQNPDIGLILRSLAGGVPIHAGGRPIAGLDDSSAQIISQAVDELIDGAVIADLFLPYRVSCEGPCIQFVLPKPIPTFTVDIGCSNADSMALVSIVAQGGVAPYAVSVDQGAYQSLNGALWLSADVHLLKVRDAEGVESASQSIVVAGPIRFGEPRFTCDEGRYKATVRLSGGTPPYSVNGQVIEGAEFTTSQTPSGDSVEVQVADSRNCTARATFTHECQTCTLPCAGIAVRRAYRFWLPEADPNNPYVNYELGNVVFKVEAKEGSWLDLSADVRAVLRDQPDLTPQGFAGQVARWLQKINGLIASTAGLHDGAISWLTLGYKSLGPGKHGQLWIEHFECLGFDIQIETFFTRKSGNDRVRVSYSPELAFIDIGETRFKIPASEGTKTDKCSQHPVPVPLCPEPPGIRLQITPAEGGTRTTTLQVTATPNAPGLIFLWDVPDAVPGIAEGQTFKPRFLSQGVKQVTVTAFFKGCSVSETARITILD